MTLTECPAPLVAFAQRLADVGGPIIRRYFRAPFAVEGKSDASPVTIADRETEQAMRELLEQTYPDHGVWGEEFGQTRMDAEWVWVLDPIDGTRAFASGKPIFGSLIGLLHCSIPVLGVIDQPVLGERWIGGVGVPTTFNDTPARTRPCATLAEAVAVVSPNGVLEKPDLNLSPYRALAKACATDSLGGDCYAYGLLSSGFCDLVCERGLKLHDYAALAPVVTAAGGVMTDWQGQPLGLDSNGEVMATGDRRVWREALALVKSAS